MAGLTREQAKELIRECQTGIDELQVKASKALEKLSADFKKQLEKHFEDKIRAVSRPSVTAEKANEIKHVNRK